jgi:hypothetical protein
MRGSGGCLAPDFADAPSGLRLLNILITTVLIAMSDILVHRFPIEKTFDHHGYPAVGRCIYCESPDTHLTKEHIIGKAIGGTVTLAKASCVKCRDITRDIEQFCFRGVLRNLRLRDGFKSSHPKGQPVKARIRSMDDTQTVIEVPTSELPNVMVLPKVPPPICIFGEWPTPASVSLVVLDVGVESPMNHRIDIGPFCADTYGKMLAKIAHSYAVAELGIENFDPLLPAVIADDASMPFRFVGCIGQVGNNLPKEDILHRLSFECWEVSGVLYAVVVIRILAYTGAPDYHVVVGTVPEIPMAAMTRGFSSRIASTQNL